MNDNKNKRSAFGAIWPYLFIAIVLCLLVTYAIVNLTGSGTTWTADQLDTILRVDGNYDKNSSVLVKTANVQEGRRTVKVTGQAYMYANTDKTYSYTVEIEREKWNSPFDVTKVEEDGTVTVVTANGHASWSTIFAARIDEWNSNATLKQNYGSGYFQVVDIYATNWWTEWGPTIILILGVTIIGIIFFVRLNGSVNGANRQAMDFNKSPARREDASKIRFTDVAGCDEEKAEMVEMVDYLRQPKKYSKFGARLPKGVLLIGPPGTGKTLLAKAVAGEAGVPFYSISGSDFVEMFVGVGAGRVRDLFKRAKQTAPCIVFIDEIDAVGRQRGAGMGGGNDEREQTLNQLLVEMDGFEYNSGILVIAATNRDDVLDPALLRPGRFDRIITVSLPNAAGREAIFKVHARNKKIDPSVDFKALAKRTVGFSGADIENILNEAAILAVRFNKDDVGMSEIDEAIDRRIAGPAKSGKGMNDQERKEVAFHEAGHAVIGLVLPYSEKVQKITIIPRGRTGGHVLMAPEDDRFLLTKKELLAQITGLLGGRASEEIFFDDISTGAENDIQQATKIARMMVTSFGMSELGPIQYENDQGSVFLGRDYTNVQRNFSSEVAFEIDKAVRQIIDDAHEHAKKILTEHKKDVILIADTLLEKETITAEEIDSLVKIGTLPTKKKAEVRVVDKEASQVFGAEPQTKKAPAKKPATAKKPVKPKATHKTAPKTPKADDKADKGSK
jgi:cell division protease FtsH